MTGYNFEPFMIFDKICRWRCPNDKHMIYWFLITINSPLFIHFLFAVMQRIKLQLATYIQRIIKLANNKIVIAFVFSYFSSRK